MRHAKTDGDQWGRIIACPKCGKWQPLVLEGDENQREGEHHSGPYAVQDHGVLHPQFVCMGSNGSYCQLACTVSIALEDSTS